MSPPSTPTSAANTTSTIMATLPATFLRLRLLALAGGRKRLGWEPAPGLEVAWSDDLKRCPCELTLLCSNRRNRSPERLRTFPSAAPRYPHLEPESKV